MKNTVSMCYPAFDGTFSHELYVLQGMDIPLNGTGEYDKQGVV